MLYTSADKLQFQAGLLKQGKYKHANVDQEILDWINRQFTVCALDFLCEKRENPKSASQQVVHIVMETVDDVKKMQANHVDVSLILKQFLTYFTSGDRVLKDPLKTDALPFETVPYPEIIITYRPLKGLSSKILEEMLADEKLAVLNTFENVWTISQHIIFFMTDAQVKENLTNGTSAKITEQLQLIDDMYDFKQSYAYSFDSKESFDRDYDSKWHYYWK